MNPINDDEQRRRVEAFRTEMRLKGLDDDTIDRLLSQVGQADKSAAEQHIAYKEIGVSTPRQELNMLHAALKASGVDPDSPEGQALEQLWVDEGLTVALGQAARHRAANAPRVIAQRIWPGLYGRED